MSIETEVWKEISGFDGYYYISNFGRVKSLKRYEGKNERVLTGTLSKKGYLIVKISHKNIPYSLKIHRLVMGAFFGKSDLQVNHKNGIKIDNRLENLEYVTNKENKIHAHKNGITEYILDIETVKKIKKLLLDGELTQREISDIYKINQGIVSSIKNKRRFWYI